MIRDFPTATNVSKNVTKVSRLPTAFTDMLRKGALLKANEGNPTQTGRRVFLDE